MLYVPSYLILKRKGLWRGSDIYTKCTWLILQTIHDHVTGQNFMILLTPNVQKPDVSSI